MIRALVILPLLLIVVGIGAMYISYGQIDPCRALAVERADRAADAIGLGIGGAIEKWTRLETSQMTTGQCVTGLLDSWGERAKAHTE
jgi:hypothetical protein